MSTCENTKRDLRQEWQTPDDFYSVLCAEFGFQVDAAASPENARCHYILTPEDDALSDDIAWITEGRHMLDSGDIYRIYCNPPYTNVLPWVEKAHAEAQKSPSAVVCLVAHAGLATEWFARAVELATEIRLCRPRIQFVAPPGVQQSSNARDSVVMVFRRKVVPGPARIWLWDWKDDRKEMRV